MLSCLHLKKYNNIKCFLGFTKNQPKTNNILLGKVVTDVLVYSKHNLEKVEASET